MSDTRIWIKQSVDHIDQTVLLKGWVWNRRDHGKLIFIDLRDRSGEVQMVFNPANISEAAFAVAKTLRAQDVITVTGKVLKRPESMVNARTATGTIEVEAAEVTILSHAHDLPFDLSAENFNVDESVRLKYRYLDLRRPAMQAKMMLRSQLFNLMRQYLVSHEFVEIETPMLTKSTPEGARDFIVPSRLQPGKFYALPQSPQQYKQLLMVAGMERYFQFARCVRDEDLRADRGFEFTQLDLEMSFVDR